MRVDVFDQMGHALEEAWRARDYDEACFPELALEALAAHPPARSVEPYAFLRWATQGVLPAQVNLDASFGEPPVTVFRAPRFYIEVLFWLDGTTSVHQHSFSGAFHVLAGSSVHAQHRFELRHRVTAQLQLGDLRLTHAELLRAGDSRPIRSGSPLIHSLFHLERPSVSVVVRTYQDLHTLPQLKYLRPHVAIASKLDEPTQVRRLQVLRSLFRLKPTEFLSLAGELVQALDLQSSFEVLELASEVLGSTRALSLLLEEARKRHGSWVDLFGPVFAESRRLATLVAQRNLVQEPDARFFVALVMNLPDRPSILRFLAERWPDRDPVETALGLFERVTQPTADPKREVPTTVDWSEPARALVRCLLSGADAPAAPELEGLRRTLQERHPYQRLFTP